MSCMLTQNQQPRLANGRFAETVHGPGDINLSDQSPWHNVAMRQREDLAAALGVNPSRVSVNEFAPPAGPAARVVSASAVDDSGRSWDATSRFDDAGNPMGASVHVAWDGGWVNNVHGPDDSADILDMAEEARNMIPVQQRLDRFNDEQRVDGDHSILEARVVSLRGGAVISMSDSRNSDTDLTCLLHMTEGDHPQVDAVDVNVFGIEGFQTTDPHKMDALMERMDEEVGWTLESGPGSLRPRLSEAVSGQGH